MEWSRCILLIAIFAFSTLAFPTASAGQAGCTISVDAGTDQILCSGNQSVTLAAQISGDYIDLNWTPADGLTSPDQPSTQALINNTITYVLTVRSRSEVNLITNGDFSQGDTGFTSDYIYGTGGSSGLLTSEGQYAIDDNPGDTHNRFADCSDHTTGNGNMMVVNASGQEDNFWCQSVTVNEGTSYDFSAWVTSVNAQNPARLQFSIDGDLLGSQFNATADLCNWQEFAAQWTAPATAAVEICVVNVNLTPAGNDFAIDDIAFREICITTDSVTFTVPELNPDWTAPAPLCQNDGIITLNDLLSAGATSGGIWTLDGADVTTLDPTKLDAGTYQLTYTVTENNCQEADTQTIEVLEAPYAGAPGPELQYCAGSNITLILADEISGEDAGGIWTETSLTGSSAGAFDPATSRLNVGALAPGDYTFNYAVGANSPCGSSENEVRIMVEAPPSVDLGEDRSLNCDITELVLDGGTGSDPDLRFSWTDQAGNQLGSEPTLVVANAGTYRLEVTDIATNCRAEDEIIISDLANTAITAVVSSSDVRCFDSADGRIIISDPAGGTPPYLFALNNNPFSANTQFANLSPGNYQVTIMDAAGCTAGYQVQINAPSQLQVTILSDEPVISAGDSIRLEAVINNPVADIIWSPAPTNCPNCSVITVSPPRTTTYEVAVTDQNGCTASARLTVQVKQTLDVFVPNAFSPNEDGVNDRFFVNAGSGILIRQLQVVDRWGNVLFQRRDLAPNDPTAGWDGSFRGNRVPSGVVVYSMELELPNGEVVIQSGELAVIY